MHIILYLTECFLCWFYRALKNHRNANFYISWSFFIDAQQTLEQLKADRLDKPKSAALCGDVETYEPQRFKVVRMNRLWI
jgi:hypothetical protein